MQVMKSERESLARIKVFKERDQALVQLRYESSIRSQLDKEEVIKTLAKWAHSGFDTSRANLLTGGHSGAQSPIASKSITDF